MEETTPIAAPPAEPTIEDQIKALVAETETPQAEAAAPVEEPKAEPSLEDQLKALEAETPKVEEPKVEPLNEDQRQVLNAIPDAKTLETVHTSLNNYRNFTNAFERGDFDTVEEMFTQWKPEVYEAFLNHIYNKKVVSEEWVNRWIQDKEVPSSANAQLAHLQSQIKQLQTQLSGKAQEESKQQKQVNEQQIYAQYNSHIKSLFDMVKTPETDRNVLADLIVARVNRDERVKSAILSGNAKAVNSIFAQTVREFNGRDQATKQVQDSALKAQEIKKLPVTTLPSTETSYTEDGYTQAPKEQRAAYREQLEQQQLANLFATRGKAKR